MSSAKSRRRRRIDSDDEAGDAGTQTPEPLKRARRSTLQQDGRADAGAGVTNGDSHFVDMNKFQPGSIVRVAVQNFVTYEKAEFYPGPYLNMVIGPNGTGKSSLVCAICLGLGYSPKHLGRAGSVKEFVKHGRDKATIEIELQKRPSDRHNFVIRVQIRRDQNNQKWWLNGKECSHKTIQDLMKSLKIQVDNLCQFLPQDRVVEFAASTPVELLKETIRAAAPEEMLLWQDKLREIFKEKKELEENSQNDVDTLQNLESRQEGLQADVDRLRERDEIQKRLDDLKIVRVLASYQEARNKYNSAKENKKKAQDSLRRLETESGPSLQAVNQKQSYLDRINAALSAKSRALEQSHDLADALDQKVKDEDASIEAFMNKSRAEKQLFHGRKRDVAAARTRLTSLQADLKNRPGDFNAGEWNQKIRGEEHNLRELESTDRGLEAEAMELRDQVREPNRRIESLQKSIESFDTQEGQQLNMMNKNFPEVAKAWDWIKSHSGEFEKEVFAPPMISCSIKDERYSSQVQSLLQMDDFTCFTAQTHKDFKTLTHQLYRVMSLSVVIRSVAQPLSNYQSPANKQEAVRLGLDGFAVDFLEGPEPVLAMLCSEKRLHQSGISLKDHDNDQYNQLANSGAISQWAAGRHMFTLRRRKEYGGKAMTAISKFIQPGRFWTSQPVDMQEKTELMRQLQEVKEEKHALRDKNIAITEKRKAITSQKDDIMNKIDELKREKNALQREYQKWQSLPEKIEAEERRRDENMQMMETIRNRIYAMQHDRDKLVMAKFTATMRHAASLESIREAHREWVEAKIQHIEATSDVKGLKKRNARIVAELDVERSKLEEATRLAETTRAAGRELGEKVRDILADHEDRREHLQNMAENKTEHEVEMEMEAEKAQLELIHAANPNILREFEKRAAEIARLRRKLDGVHGKVAELTATQASLMGKWEPKLDELIAQINSAFAYNFEQINCSGEVHVHKDADFEQWALNIMVRFRYVPQNWRSCHFSSFWTSILTGTQRHGNATAAHRAPPIRRRARRLDHLLPDGAAVARAVALPRRRRDQPGHGPAQRAHGARAHGGNRLPRAHEPVFPHHAQAPPRAAVRPQDARAVHCERRVHAPRRREAGFQPLLEGHSQHGGCGVKCTLCWLSLCWEFFFRLGVAGD